VLIVAEVDGKLTFAICAGSSYCSILCVYESNFHFMVFFASVQ